MKYTHATLRPTLVDILVGMGEIDEAQGSGLRAAPGSDISLAQLSFDSLTTLDFCLKVETATEIVIDPDELVALQSLRDLEAAILAKQPG